MCWNAEVSLQTFIISCIGIAILYNLNCDKGLIAFIFSFVIIQLVEFFMWIYINKPYINRYFGLLSSIIVLSQPIVLLYFTKYSRYIWLYILLLFIVFIICILFFGLKYKSFDFVPKIAKNGHLRWDWFHNKYLFILGFIVYISFFLGILYLTRFNAFIVALITIIYSSYNYGKYGTFSSMWCWIANYSILLCIIYEIYKKMII